MDSKKSLNECSICNTFRKSKTGKPDETFSKNSRAFNFSTSAWIVYFVHRIADAWHIAGGVFAGIVDSASLDGVHSIC